MYSHVVYDIVDGEEIVVSRPDIVILEGLNVLQVPATNGHEFVSDYFDFSIYLDADEADIEQWYVERFLALRETVFQDPDCFFRHFADLTDDEAVDDRRGDLARDQRRATCATTSLPTRERASLIVHKDADHRVDEVRLHKL